MGRPRLYPDRVLTPAERLKRFRDRRRGLPVPFEAPDPLPMAKVALARKLAVIMHRMANEMAKAGMPLATAVEAMEEAGLKLATVDEMFADANANAKLADASSTSAQPAPAAPARFDPLALIG
jgi:hypothetical protein